jgi:hypothetical protein
MKITAVVLGAVGVVLTGFVLQVHTVQLAALKREIETLKKEK